LSRFVAPFRCFSAVTSGGAFDGLSRFVVPFRCFSVVYQRGIFGILSRFAPIIRRRIVWRLDGLTVFRRLFAGHVPLPVAQEAILADAVLRADLAQGWPAIEQQAVNRLALRVSADFARLRHWTPFFVRI
jgi:hypothetical protein